MKSSDRMIVLALGLVGLLGAFWFLAISPKRAELSELDEGITNLEASVAEQEQLAIFAEQAEADYDQDYHRLVVLGKAIPGDDDSASLIDQTQSLADSAGIDFRTIVLAAPEAAPPAPAAAQTTADPPPGESAPEGTETTPAAASTTTAVPATETAAAALPIGATVGAAGLPVLPYDLTFGGDFFEIADFMSEVDGMVRVDAKGVGVEGRLLTVDGFALIGDQDKGLPHLDVNLRVTSYVTPADQGLTAGATEVAPAPVPGAPVAPATPTTTATPGTMTP